MSEAPLLDTHAWVWWVQGDARLGRHVIEKLDRLPADDRPAISDISLWEVATLASLGRIEFPGTLESWLAIAASPKTVRVLPVTPRIAAEVARLPDSFHRDPADRLIVATSRVHGMKLLTKDTAVSTSGLVRLWSPGPVSIQAVRGQLPRTYEIRDEVPALAGYFERLEPLLIKGETAPAAFWSKREQAFASLAPEEWDSFKAKVRLLPAPADIDGRGWQAFFDLLSEATACSYLLKAHCTNIRFVSAASSRRPDIEAVRGGKRVLCEVKTVNRSEGKAEIGRLVERGGSRVDSPFELSDGFFRKLDHDVAAAVEQLRQYDPNHEADWIVFICLNTDDLIGDGRQAHLRMIDAHLAGKSKPASLVFYFLTNNFEHHLEMTNAEIYID